VRIGNRSGAVLVPGLGGAEWENGVTNRLAMFRDFAHNTETSSWRQNDEFRASLRLIGLQKVNGCAFGEDGDIGQLIAFTLSKNKVEEVEHAPAVTSDKKPEIPAALSPAKARKRGHEEIADSDAEELGSEYGWLDEDAEGLLDAAALNEDPHVVEVKVTDNLRGSPQ